MGTADNMSEMKIEYISFLEPCTDGTLPLLPEYIGDNSADEDYSDSDDKYSFSNIVLDCGIELVEVENVESIKNLTVLPDLMSEEVINDENLSLKLDEKEINVDSDANNISNITENSES